MRLWRPMRNVSVAAGYGVCLGYGMYLGHGMCLGYGMCRTSFVASQRWRAASSMVACGVARSRWRAQKWQAAPNLECAAPPPESDCVTTAAAAPKWEADIGGEAATKLVRDAPGGEVTGLATGSGSGYGSGWD